MKIPSIFLTLLGVFVLFSQVLAITSTTGPTLTTITSGSVTKTLVLKTTTYTDCPCAPTIPSGGIAAAVSDLPVVVTTSGSNKLLPRLMVGVVGLVGGVYLI